MSVQAETIPCQITTNARLGSLERELLCALNDSAHGLIRVSPSEKASAARLVKKTNGRVRLDVALYLADVERYGVTRRPAFQSA